MNLINSYICIMSESLCDFVKVNDLNVPERIFDIHWLLIDWWILRLVRLKPS